MTQRYLEVTYRKGKPFAAYLYLPRMPGDTSVRTERRAPGLVIDFADDDRAIGIEIASPAKISLEAINRTLMEIDQDPVTEQEVEAVAGPSA